MSIPYVDLKAQYDSIKNEIDAAIESCIVNTSFIGGKVIGEFERDFAVFAGAKYCVGCANGTDAIEIALKALGIGPGDQVIVPALTWISTAGAVNNVGAEPVFIDVDSESRNLDVTQIESKINQHTRAIIPVHLYGLPADMPTIMSIAEKHGLKVIEDSAQAHGAEVNGRKIGTFGDIATFSFYPGKNLGAYGDAGGIITNDATLAKVCKMMTNHGQPKKHTHEMIGRNSRLDTMQAAILKAKLPYLESWTDGRIANAHKYNSLLTQVKIPAVPEGYKHVYHVYAIQSKSRDEIKAALDAQGIGNMIHYPMPLPLVKSFAYKGHKQGEFPNAEKLCSEILSIPMFPELREDQIKQVAKVVNQI